jgi:hypothetical protein
MKIINDVCEYSDGVICDFEDCVYYDLTVSGSKKFHDGYIKHQYILQDKEMGFYEEACKAEKETAIIEIDCPLLRYFNIRGRQNEC